MRLIRPAAAAAVLYVGCLSATPSARSAAEDTRKLLQEIAGFTAADWAAVEAGRPVAKILETDSREIGIAGAVRIAASRDLLIARIREIENLQRSAVVLNAGRFGRTPQPADLKGVPIEDYSLDLRECKPGDCRVRLAAEDIARFHREVDWRKDKWRLRAETVWREVLAGYAAKYVSAGRAALPVYANKRESLSVASELTLLVGKFGFVARYSPELHAYLREFGPERPAGAEDTLYWTKDDFGVRPVLRVSHQIIYPVARDVPAVVVATNQVYADHYLDAALGIMLAIDTSEGEGVRGFYMVAINRARTRSLSGILRSMVRGTVQNRSRDAMRKILTATKAALEDRTSGGPTNRIGRHSRVGSIAEPAEEAGCDEHIEQIATGAAVETPQPLGLFLLESQPGHLQVLAADSTEHFLMGGNRRDFVHCAPQLSSKRSRRGG